MSGQMDSVAWARRKWEERQGPSPDAFAAMVATLRLARLVRARLEDLLREYDLTLTTYLLFATLRLEHDRTLTLGELSKRLMLHPTTVTLIVDKTHALRLATRTRHPSDGRVTLVSLTNEGERLLEALTTTLSAVNFGLTGVDASTIESLVENVSEVLHRISAS